MPGVAPSDMVGPTGWFNQGSTGRTSQPAKLSSHTQLHQLLLPGRRAAACCPPAVGTVQEGRPAPVHPRGWCRVLGGVTGQAVQPEPSGTSSLEYSRPLGLKEKVSCNSRLFDSILYSLFYSILLLCKHPRAGAQKNGLVSAPPAPEGVVTEKPMGTSTALFFF